MLQSNQKISRHKVGLLNLAEELGNVSKACQVMGLSRDTVYRYRDALRRKAVSRRCWRGRAGFPTRRTGSILKRRKRLSPTPSNTRPMARSSRNLN